MDGLNTYIVSKAVRQHRHQGRLMRVGRDEFFGGYPSFTDVRRIRSMARWIEGLPGGGRRAIANLLTIRKSAVTRKFSDMMGGRCDIASLALHRRRLLNDQQLAALGLTAEDLGLSESFLPAKKAEAWLPPPDADPGWAISLIESRFYQTNVLLRDSDANGMAHSLEIRVPYLDRAW